MAPEDAIAACEQAIEALGWNARAVESLRIVAKVGFPYPSIPAQLAVEIRTREAMSGFDKAFDPGAQTLFGRASQLVPILRARLRSRRHGPRSHLCLRPAPLFVRY